MKTRINIAQNDIDFFFKSQAKFIYKLNELRTIFAKNKDRWLLKQSETTQSFINEQIKLSRMKKFSLRFPNRKETLYTWGDASIYQVLMNLNAKTYFSHYTAMMLNELTEQLPKTIYINTEQFSKGSGYSDGLEQRNIDVAFKNKGRETNNFTVVDEYKVYHLNGKFTNNLGVIETNLQNIGNVRVSNIERTLLDITVRPQYSGGVFEILKAYKKAKNFVSINKLISYLKKINYTYPYHQSIGFYLDRAGYSQTQIGLLSQFENKYDFYIDYKIANPQYDPKWKVFFPKGL